MQIIDREKGFLVYPVYSRRSGGLSIGINLFPGQKECPFDCPYCEIFPFSTNEVFSTGQMEDGLRAAVLSAAKQKLIVKDICFSGNGEPTMSAAFPPALEAAGRIRAELAPDARLVLITCGAGLLDKNIFSRLEEAALGDLALDIWLKLDAGTPEWYKQINRSGIPHEKLIAKIKEFSGRAPLTIQTMLCEADGLMPPAEEAEAWEKLVLELASAPTGPVGTTGSAGSIRKIQIYGKARPSPEDPNTRPLPVSCLEDRAASLRQALSNLLPAGRVPPVEVYP
jgi:histidinol dehydrogenase